MIRSENSQITSQYVMKCNMWTSQILPQSTNSRLLAHEWRIWLKASSQSCRRGTESKELKYLNKETCLFALDEATHLPRLHYQSQMLFSWRAEFFQMVLEFPSKQLTGFSTTFTAGWWASMILLHCGLLRKSILTGYERSSVTGEYKGNSFVG